MDGDRPVEHVADDHHVLPCGAEFPDGNLVQFVILRTERIETLFAVHQKTETFAVGELRDENLADLQRVRNVGTAHERAAADLLHVVDAASVEGRDPIEDVHAIMDELSAYNPELLKLPQAIAANKLDAVYDEGADPLADLKKEFEPMGIPVFGISAVSGEGVNDLLYYLYDVIRKTDRTPKIFEKEFEIEYVGDRSLPYTVEKDEEGIYVVEGPRIEKMLGYTNLDSEKGFDFFQKFLKQSGILADLEKAGIQEGDTVRMYGLVFDYYK